MGAPDWRLKLSVMQLLFRQSRPNDVLTKHFDEDDYEEWGLNSQFVFEYWSSRFGSSKFTDKSKYQKILSEMSFIMGVDEAIGGSILANGSLQDFLSSLPSDGIETIRNGLRPDYRRFTNIPEDHLKQIAEALSLTSGQSTDQSATPYGEVGSASGAYPILVDRNRKNRSIRESLSAGSIDQSEFYLHPDSVPRWYDVTNNAMYSGFDQCITGLKRLTHRAEWRQFISSGNCKAAIMLGGGGSPSKDCVIINSVLSQRDKIAMMHDTFDFVLVDTSYCMLKASRENIERNVGLSDLQRIPLTTTESDILSLPSEGLYDRQSQTNRAWFLTGGTLGNLNEEKFFESISAVADDGDWLVLAVPCAPKNPTAKYLDELEREYDQSVVQNLVTIPLSAVWSTLEVADSLHNVQKSIQIKATHYGPDSGNGLRNSVVVRATAEVAPYGTIRLFKATRYNPDALRDLASAYHWDFAFAEDGLTDEFKQLIFIYRGGLPHRSLI